MTLSDKLFGHTNPVKLFFIAAIPGAISMLASNIYQTLDGAIVGQGLGSTAFAAINLAMPFVIINFAFADLIGVGSAVPISISLGKGKQEEANGIFSASVLLIVGASAVLGLLLVAGAPLLIGLMGADGEFKSLAVLYLRVYAAFSPITTIVFAMDNYLKICGKVKTSMMLNILMSVLAAIFEIVFIFAFHWGIWSAALATCLSMFISAVIAIIPFAFGRRSLKFVRPHLTKDVVRRIISCGLPNFLNNVAGRLASIVMNTMLIKYGGQTAVSAYGVMMYADGLIQPIMYGSCDALQPALGYNWGAGKYSRARKIEKCCIIAAIVICLASFLLITFFPSQLVRLFVAKDNTELIELSIRALSIFAYAYLFRWIGFSTQSFLLAIEKPAPATLISICIAFIFPMLLILALSPLGLDGIWLNFAGTNILGAILSIIILMKERKYILQKDEPMQP